MRLLVPPCAVALAVLLTATARSQPPGPQIKDGRLLLAIRANPAVPPVPAFRYTLLPTIRESRPGNQLPAFYKCFMEQGRLFFDKDETEKREKWLTAPLAELAGVKELEGYGGLAFRQAQKAARLEAVDWQLLDDVRVEGVNLILNDVQQLRELARVLRVRARGEIARGDYDGAVETIQTHMALARTFNEHPTLIGALVGVAIAAQALSSVEELIAQPEAPNLYWALADLPNPLFDLRKATHGERNFLTADLGPYLDRKNPMTEAQIGLVVMKVTTFFDQITLKEGLAPAEPAKGDGPPKPAPAWKTPATYLGERAADPKQVAEARAKLLPAPPTRDLRVEKFPPMQVILIDEVNRFEAARDDVLKWLSVPAWQLPADPGRAVPPGIFTPLAPAVLKVSIARNRIQQQIGMLQAVEGLRAHAAANGGRFPATMADVRLPVPVDPFTGRPFAYELRADTAVVRGTPPPDFKKDATLNRVYELTLRK